MFPSLLVWMDFPRGDLFSKSRILSTPSETRMSGDAVGCSPLGSCIYALLHQYPPPIHQGVTKSKMFNQCWFYVGPASETVAQHQTNIGWMCCVCCDSHTLSQCCFNVRPASQTVDQHWNNIGLMSRVEPFSVRIHFRRQNLTSIDVRCWRL